MTDSAASAPEPPPASGRYGPYEILQEIGRGGMGSVYRARHVETGVERALKVVRPKDDPTRAERAFMRLQREAETLEAIEPHPGIVQLHDLGMEGTHPWYAMDLIRGKPLSKLLHDGPLEPARAARIVAGVARAIEHVHSHGVIHRDIKPGNILVDREDQPHLCDFGLAFDAMALERLTGTGEFVGTPAFMAPEVVSNPAKSEEEELRPEVDVYGLGAVLYATLTGGPPFPGLGFTALVESIVDQDPLPPRARNADVPRPLEAICLRAMAKRADDRFETASDLADDLERFVAGEPVRTRLPGPLRELARRLLPASARARRSLALAVLVAAIIFLIGAVLYSVNRFVQGARAAEQRRADEVRALASRFDAAFTRATSGDAAAVADAVAAGDRLGELGALEAAALGGRLEVARGLARLAGGDEALARAVPLDAEPWRAHRAAIVRVLVSAGRTRALGLVLEREPVLLDDPGVAEMLANAVADGRATPSAELTALLVGALDRASRSAGAADLARLRVAVLARRLEQLLGANEPAALADLDAVLRPLLAALHGGEAEPPAIGDAAIERLVITAGGLDAATDLERIRRLGRVAEAIFLLLPPEDPRATAIVASLQNRVIAAVTTSASAERGAMFELGLMLDRMGALPTRLENLEAIAPETARLRARADELMLDGGRGDPSALWAVVFILLERDERERRETSATTPYREAIAAHWPWLEALLAREHERRDLPGWVVSGIASALARARGEAPAPDVALAGRVAAAFGRGEGDADLDRQIDRLHEVAFARDTALPIDRRRIDVPLAWAEWLIFGTGRAADRRARIALVEGLARAESVRRAERTRLNQHAVTRLSVLVDDALAACDALADADPGNRDPCPTGEAILELARAARRAVPESPRGIEMEALHVARHGERERAIARLDEAIALGRRTTLGRSTLWTAWLRKARLLAALDRRDEARAMLDAKDAPVLGASYQLRERAEVWEALGDAGRAADDRTQMRVLEARGR